MDANTSVRMLVARYAMGASVVLALMCAGLAYAAYTLSVTERRWADAVELRDPRPLAVSRLRHQLGYGGLVHDYLNAILRPGTHGTVRTELDLGAVRAAMFDVQTLDMSPIERAALRIIEQELDKVRLALVDMETGTFAGLPAEEIYAQAGVDPGRIAAAVDTISSVTFGDVSQDTPNHHLLLELESALGLNGIVHHLKVYVLTRNPPSLEQAFEAVDRARRLHAWLAAADTSNAEREALRVIATTISSYENSLFIARDMGGTGASAAQIDTAVRVDDSAAISGYATLMSVELARLERSTDAVSFGLFAARTMIIALIVLLLVPCAVLFLRAFFKLRAALPRWSETVADIATALADEDFEKSADYSSLPAELAILQEPLTAIRRRLWFRRERALEGEAQVAALANEKEQMGAKLAHLRGALDEATQRAQAAEAERHTTARTNAMMGHVMGALSNAVLATRGFDDILFWNRSLAELASVPPEWFSADRTLRDLILYFATRGDYGRGDPMQIAGKVEARIHEQLDAGVYRVDQSFAGKRVLALEIVRRDDGMIVFSGTDITERHEHTRAMEQQAVSDPLTGLGNRSALKAFAASMLKHAARTGEKAAFLTLDLDNFKPVNDKYGHAAGDETLIALAKRLREEARETDFIARTGGDEFMMVLLHLDDKDSAVHWARRLLRAIEVPITLAEGRQVQLSGSIGVSIFPDDSRDLEMLYQHADVALYGAKAAGRNCVRTYADVARFEHPDGVTALGA